MKVGEHPATDTVLFTDLVGFTEYTDACGDRAAVAVLDVQSAIAASVLDDVGVAGRVVKELGDGLLLWFAHPAHALATATSMLAAVDEARSGDRFPLAIRMGMHTGEVIARGDDVVGRTVNVAARIVDLAGPGELVVSHEVIDELEPTGASFEPVGPARVKGIGTPIWLYRYAGRPAIGDGRPTAPVGAGEPTPPAPGAPG